MKCLDTTYFIDMIRRPHAIRDLTKKLDAEGIHATTVVNVYESLIGAFAVGGERGEKMKDKLTKAFNKLEILDFTYKDAVLAAEIGGKLIKMGKDVGSDAIIAAIAINNGCEAIVTRNEKHFKLIEQITGLKVETYRI
jgi:predicted nucleic acid-binding protein